MMRRGSAGQGTFALDPGGCINLQQVVDAFNSHINEEHAWALIHQAARCFQKCLAEGATCFVIKELRHVFLHKDGCVHPKTLLVQGDDSGREEVTSEQQLVESLALVVYSALDYTTSDDEELPLSPDLEGLIKEMTPDAADDDEEEAAELSEVSSETGRADTDDEGIERDAEPTPRRGRWRPRFLLRDVIERCVWHCGGGRCARDAAASHYRAVCRALVAEALELASFLLRVRSAGARDLGAAEDSATHLDTLHLSDWARFWMQVIGELRMGVKLKKVNHTRTPIEYEMTPYEILMDDIRSRRYTLRKVDGVIPQSVKKDAHAMILEFIRSRPPLKKASERKLAPVRQEATPRDKLLAAIKRGRRLRNTANSTQLSSNGGCSGATGAGSAGAAGAQPQRRLIKVDRDLLDDDEDDDDTESFMSPGVAAPQPLPRRTLQQTATTPPKPWKRTAYDLATQCPSRRASLRRHTLANAHCPPADGALSLPHSRPESRGSCAGGASIASSDADAVLGDLSWSHSSLQEDLVNSKQWQEAITSEERLSLTLEEIVHIRSVLTKAELEVLPVEGRVKEDVEKRRVCFLCLKTRFGIFGPWGQKCKLCKKTVCQKCCSKMRIPTEHFSQVPVALLSPALSPERTSSAHLDASISQENGVGSAPGSPRTSRSTSGSRGPSAPPAPSTTTASDLMSRSVDADAFFNTPHNRLRHGRGVACASVADRLRGVQMAVCHDCKAMVLQIIKSTRAARSASRDKLLRNLTLDLAPVYSTEC